MFGLNQSRRKKKSGDGFNMPLLTERQQIAILLSMTAQEGKSEERNSGDDTIDRKKIKKVQPSSVLRVNRPKNKSGETQLHISAMKGDLDDTKSLVKQGADVNCKDNAGWTPLHEACNHGHYKVAKVLIKAGAVVNVQGLEGDTPLHDASSNGHLKLVLLLLRHGANPHQKNDHGETPIDVAEEPHIKEALKKFKKDMLAGLPSKSDITSPLKQKKIESSPVTPKKKRISNIADFLDADDDVYSEDIEEKETKQSFEPSKKYVKETESSSSHYGDTKEGGHKSKEHFSQEDKQTGKIKSSVYENKEKTYQTLEKSNDKDKLRLHSKTNIPGSSSSSNILKMKNFVITKDDNNKTVESKHKKKHKIHRKEEIDTYEEKESHTRDIQKSMINVKEKISVKKESKSMSTLSRYRMFEDDSDSDESIMSNKNIFSKDIQKKTKQDRSDSDKSVLKSKEKLSSSEKSNTDHASSISHTPKDKLSTQRSKEIAQSHILIDNTKSQGSKDVSKHAVPSSKDQLKIILDEIDPSKAHVRDFPKVSTQHNDSSKFTSQIIQDKAKQFAPSLKYQSTPTALSMKEKDKHVRKEKPKILQTVKKDLILKDLQLSKEITAVHANKTKTPKTETKELKSEKDRSSYTTSSHVISNKQKEKKLSTSSNERIHSNTASKDKDIKKRKSLSESSEPKHKQKDKESASKDSTLIKREVTIEPPKKVKSNTQHVREESIKPSQEKIHEVDKKIKIDERKLSDSQSDLSLNRQKEIHPSIKAENIPSDESKELAKKLKISEVPLQIMKSVDYKMKKRDKEKHKHKRLSLETSKEVNAINTSEIKPVLTQNIDDHKKAVNLPTILTEKESKFEQKISLESAKKKEHKIKKHKRSKSSEKVDSWKSNEHEEVKVKKQKHNNTETKIEKESDNAVPTNKFLNNEPLKLTSESLDPEPLPFSGMYSRDPLNLESSDSPDIQRLTHDAMHPTKKRISLTGDEHIIQCGPKVKTKSPTRELAKACEVLKQKSRHSFDGEKEHTQVKRKKSQDTNKPSNEPLRLSNKKAELQKSKDLDKSHSKVQLKSEHKKVKDEAAHPPKIKELDLNMKVGLSDYASLEMDNRKRKRKRSSESKDIEHSKHSKKQSDINKSTIKKEKEEKPLNKSKEITHEKSSNSEKQKSKLSQATVLDHHTEKADVKETSADSVKTLQSSEGVMEDSFSKVIKSSDKDEGPMEDSFSKENESAVSCLLNMEEEENLGYEFENITASSTAFNFSASQFVMTGSETNEGNIDSAIASIDELETNLKQAAKYNLNQDSVEKYSQALNISTAPLISTQNIDPIMTHPKQASNYEKTTSKDIAITAAPTEIFFKNTFTQQSGQSIVSPAVVQVPTLDKTLAQEKKLPSAKAVFTTLPHTSSSLNTPAVITNSSMMKNLSPYVILTDISSIQNPISVSTIKKSSTNVKATKKSNSLNVSTAISQMTPLPKNISENPQVDLKSKQIVKTLQNIGTENTVSNLHPNKVKEPYSSIDSSWKTEASKIKPNYQANVHPSFKKVITLPMKEQESFNKATTDTNTASIKTPQEKMPSHGFPSKGAESFHLPTTQFQGSQYYPKIGQFSPNALANTLMMQASVPPNESENNSRVMPGFQTGATNVPRPFFNPNMAQNFTNASQEFLQFSQLDPRTLSNQFNQQLTRNNGNKNNHFLQQSGAVQYQNFFPNPFDILNNPTLPQQPMQPQMFYQMPTGALSFDPEIIPSSTKSQQTSSSFSPVQSNVITKSHFVPPTSLHQSHTPSVPPKSIHQSYPPSAPPKTMHQSHPPSVLPTALHQSHPSSIPPIALHQSHPSSVPPKSTHQSHPQSIPPTPIHQSYPPSTPPKSMHQSHPSSVPPKKIHQSHRPSVPPKSKQQSHTQAIPPTSIHKSYPPSAPPKTMHQSHPPSVPPITLHQSHPSSVPPKSIHQSHPLSIPPKSMHQSHPSSVPPKKIHQSNLPSAPPKSIHQSHPSSVPPMSAHQSHTPSVPPKSIHQSHPSHSSLPPKSTHQSHPPFVPPKSIHQSHSPSVPPMSAKQSHPPSVPLMLTHQSHPLSVPPKSIHQSHPPSVPPKSIHQSHPSHSSLPPKSTHQSHPPFVPPKSIHQSHPPSVPPMPANQSHPSSVPPKSTHQSHTPLVPPKSTRQSHPQSIPPTPIHQSHSLPLSTSSSILQSHSQLTRQQTEQSSTIKDVNNKSISTSHLQPVQSNNGASTNLYKNSSAQSAVVVSSKNSPIKDETAQPKEIMNHLTSIPTIVVAVSKDVPVSKQASKVLKITSSAIAQKPQPVQDVSTDSENTGNNLNLIKVSNTESLKDTDVIKAHAMETNIPGDNKFKNTDSETKNLQTKSLNIQKLTKNDCGISQTKTSNIEILKKTESSPQVSANQAKPNSSVNSRKLENKQEADVSQKWKSTYAIQQNQNNQKVPQVSKLQDKPFQHLQPVLKKRDCSVIGAKKKDQVELKHFKRSKMSLAQKQYTDNTFQSKHKAIQEKMKLDNYSRKTATNIPFRENNEQLKLPLNKEKTNFSSNQQKQNIIPPLKADQPLENQKTDVAKDGTKVESTQSIVTTVTANTPHTTVLSSTVSQSVQSTKCNEMTTKATVSISHQTTQPSSDCKLISAGNEDMLYPKKNISQKQPVKETAVSLDNAKSNVGPLLPSSISIVTMPPKIHDKIVDKTQAVIKQSIKASSIEEKTEPYIQVHELTEKDNSINKKVTCEKDRVDLNIEKSPKVTKDSENLAKSHTTKEIQKPVVEKKTTKESNIPSSSVDTSIIKKTVMPKLIDTKTVAECKLPSSLANDVNKSLASSINANMDVSSTNVCINVSDGNNQKDISLSSLNKGKTGIKADISSDLINASVDNENNLSRNLSKEKTKDETKVQVAVKSNIEQSSSSSKKKIKETVPCHNLAVPKMIDEKKPSKSVISIVDLNENKSLIFQKISKESKPESTVTDKEIVKEKIPRLVEGNEANKQSTSKSNISKVDTMPNVGDKLPKNIQTKTEVPISLPTYNNENARTVKQENFVSNEKSKTVINPSLADKPLPKESSAAVQIEVVQSDKDKGSNKTKDVTKPMIDVIKKEVVENETDKESSTQKSYEQCLEEITNTSKPSIEVDQQVIETQASNIPVEADKSKSSTMSNIKEEVSIDKTSDDSKLSLEISVNENEKKTVTEIKDKQDYSVKTSAITSDLLNIPLVEVSNSCTEFSRMNIVSKDAFIDLISPSIRSVTSDLNEYSDLDMIDTSDLIKPSGNTDLLSSSGGSLSLKPEVDLIRANKKLSSDEIISKVADCILEMDESHNSYSIRGYNIPSTSGYLPSNIDPTRVTSFHDISIKDNVPHFSSSSLSSDSKIASTLRNMTSTLPDMVASLPNMVSSLAAVNIADWQRNHPVYINNSIFSNDNSLLSQATTSDLTQPVFVQTEHSRIPSTDEKLYSPKHIHDGEKLYSPRPSSFDNQNVRKVDLEPCGIGRSLITSDLPDVPERSFVDNKDDKSNNEADKDEKEKKDVSSTSPATVTATSATDSKVIYSSQKSDTKKASIRLRSWRQAVQQRCVRVSVSDSSQDSNIDSIMKKFAFDDNFEELQKKANGNEEMMELLLQHASQKEKLKIMLVNEVARVASNCKLHCAGKGAIGATTVLYFQQDDCSRKLGSTLSFNKNKSSHKPDMQKLYDAKIEDLIDKFQTLLTNMLAQQKIELDTLEQMLELDDHVSPQPIMSSYQRPPFNVKCS